MFVDMTPDEFSEKVLNHFDFFKNPPRPTLICYHCHSDDFFDGVCCECGASADTAVKSPGTYYGKHIRLVKNHA